MITCRKEGPKVTAPKACRLAWVDWMKGLGILMVVFGHTPGLRETRASQFLYAFHMPLFFILSGVLQRPLPETTDFWAFFKSKARRLLVPYGGYALAGFAIWYLLRSHWTFPTLAVSPAEAALTYVKGQPNFNPPLWFFLSLFVCELLAFPFFKAALDVTGIIRSGLLLAGLIFLSWKGYGLIWGIQGACLGLPFVVAGHKLSRVLDQLSRRQSRLLLLSLPLLGLAFWCSQLNGFVLMRAGACGNIVLFYLTAILGFIWVMTTIPALRFVPPVTALGKDSSVIFAVHYMVGIFLMHGGTVLVHRLGISQGPFELPFWLAFWLLWSATVWLGYLAFQRLEAKLFGAANSISGLSLR